MPYLLDTNILLRLTHSTDRDHQLIEDAVNRLADSGEELFYTPQNLMEFWCVCTRPATARGGYGKSAATTARAIVRIETVCALLPETPAVHAEWRSLVLQHQVRGVQVHDAHLVAAMRVYGIRDLLTLNTSDFKRYRQVNAVHPTEV